MQLGGTGLEQVYTLQRKDGNVQTVIIYARTNFDNLQQFLCF